MLLLNFTLPQCTRNTLRNYWLLIVLVCLVMNCFSGLWLKVVYDGYQNQLHQNKCLQMQNRKLAKILAHHHVAISWQAMQARLNNANAFIYRFQWFHQWCQSWLCLPDQGLHWISMEWQYQATNHRVHIDVTLKVANIMLLKTFISWIQQSHLLSHVSVTQLSSQTGDEGPFLLISLAGDMPPYHAMGDQHG